MTARKREAGYFAVSSATQLICSLLGLKRSTFDWIATKELIKSSRDCTAAVHFDWLVSFILNATTHTTHILWSLWFVNKY